jgi:uncharacterized protein (DUF1778 family)
VAKLGRPRSGVALRDRLIALRVTEAEYVVIRQAAYEAGQYMSELVREAVGLDA